MSDTGQYPVPVDNRNWIRSELAKLRTEIGDANRRARAAAQTAAGAASLPTFADLPNRNLIINGNFRTNQRAYVSGTALASGVYCFDRWKSAFANTTVAFTAAPQGQQVTLAGSGGDGVLRQVIEQANVPAGDYVLSWEGTALGRVYNEGGTAGAYLDSPVAVTLDGLANVVVEFLGVGSTLGQVQLERGTEPTPYEWVHITDELRRCQRYYYRIEANELVAVNPYPAVSLSGGLQAIARAHPVPMRTTPVLRNTSNVAASTFTFMYIATNAGAHQYVAVRLSSTNARSILGTYSSSDNGGTLLSPTRNVGLNDAPIQFDAEL